MFRYLAARLRHRGLLPRRFIRAGLGLERRNQELSTFWTYHLSRSRAAQVRWAPDCRGTLLTVLGAGPLRDFNSNALSRSFKRFRLVDANPLTVSYWQHLNTPVEPVITDISCCFEAWAHVAKTSGDDWAATLGFIRELGNKPVPAFSPQTDALLSLNVLSQLEVTWQELVEGILRKRFGRAFVHSREQEWLNAIRPASQALAEQHLIALETSGAQCVLLISDTEYVEYTGRKYLRKQFEAPPLSWSEGKWTAEPGIQYETTPALEGVTLDRATLAHWMPSYRLEWQDNWLWHIAPNGTETTRHGKLHRVTAFSLRRH